MKQNKFTPGPWIVDSDELDSCFVRQDIVNEYSDKNVPVASLLCGEGQDMRANAALIAAAPDLLEALDLILKDNRLMNSFSKEQAKAVMYSIAKARGDI